MKVLIADDDTLTRKLLVSYLQKWGYEATVACDGAEAWRLFEAGSFPIVISDWVMPEVTGLDFIRRIRASDKAECTYVILLTGRTQKEDLVQGMEAGADDFVTKPFDRDELRVRLREGERIIRLEQSLVEQNKLLAEARQALSGNHPQPNASEAPAELIGRVNRIIGHVTTRLGEARREMHLELNRLASCAAASSQAPSPPELAALQDRLTRLIDEAGEDLQAANELLSSWGQTASSN